MKRAPRTPSPTDGCSSRAAMYERSPEIRPRRDSGALCRCSRSTLFIFGANARVLDSEIHPVDVAHGLSVVGPNARVEHNIVTGPVGIAIHVVSVGGVVRSNRCEGGALQGIFVSNSAGALIEKNDVRGVTHGISAQSSDGVVIRKNELADIRAWLKAKAPARR